MKYDEEYYPLMVQGRQGDEAYEMFDHFVDVYLEMGLNTGDAKTMSMLLFPSVYEVVLKQRKQENE